MDKYSPNLLQLQTSINLGDTVWLCTDGGEDMGYGYYGWVIANDTTIFQKHHGAATGPRDTMESHRAEATGALAGLLFLYHYTQYFETNIPIIHHYCDNKEVVNRTKWHQSDRKPNPRRSLRPNADIHIQIDDLLETSGFEYTIFHVKGHQKNPAVKTLQSTLNDTADALATKHRKIMLKQHNYRQPILYPAAKSHLIIQNSIVTKSIFNTIVNYSGKHALEMYMTQKLHWTPSFLRQIWWHPLQQVLQKLPQNVQLFTLNFLYG